MRGINTYPREIWKRVFITTKLVCDGKLTNHKLLIMLNQEWYSITIMLIYLINSWKIKHQETFHITLFEHLDMLREFLSYNPWSGETICRYRPEELNTENFDKQFHYYFKTFLTGENKPANYIFLIGGIAFV